MKLLTSDRFDSDEFRTTQKVELRIVLLSISIKSRQIIETDKSFQLLREIIQLSLPHKR